MDVRETLIPCLLHMPRPGPGIEPATPVCALDWKSNLRLAGAWADTNHWPGLEGWFFNLELKIYFFSHTSASSKLPQHCWLQKSPVSPRCAEKQLRFVEFP